MNPRFNDTFLEYAQSRGFVIDPTRVRHPKDKPKVERAVPYVRGSFWAGEQFLSLSDAQRRAEIWCNEVAGVRVHGTTCLRPAEAFRAMEAALLLPVPTERFDVPEWAEPKVHRDFRCEVARSLYTVPYTLVGKRLKARADSKTVKFYLDGQLVKVHPRMGPGKSSTDRADFPPGKEVYATRDLDQLRRRAAEAGPAIGEYAAALLDHPLPWTKMRQVYRVLSLVKKWGAERVEAACATALEAEAVDVSLVGRMLERAKEEQGNQQPEEDLPANVVKGRFARDASEFAPRKKVAR